MFYAKMSCVEGVADKVRTRIGWCGLSGRGILGIDVD